jgi:MarR family multiple antibiotic resistance transcriptional regulator
VIENSEITQYYSDGDSDHDLYLLFTRARYLMYRAREKELQRYNISPEQTQVLFITYVLKKRATPAEISRFLLRQPNTVSAIVDRMEEKGLVEKVRDLNRKNMVRVGITEKGKKLYSLTTGRGPIHRIMGALTEDEREPFRRCLEKIMLKASKEPGLSRNAFPLEE